MLNMCLSSKKELSKFETFKLRTTAKIAFILAIVTDAEVVKTETSFLAFETANTWRYNVFSGYSFSRLPNLGFFGIICIAVFIITVENIDNINFAG